MTFTERYSFPWVLRNLAATIPLIFILTAIILNLASYYDNGFRYMVASFVFAILSVVVFTIFEFITGLNGKLIVSIKQSIHIRYTYRGLFISNIIFTWGQYFHLYRSFINFPYYRDLNSYYYGFQSMITTYVALFAFAELMVFMRDHLPRFYPLEPEFRPIIRFFTPPYLLAGFGLIIFLINPTDWDNVIWGSTLVIIGILWGIIRKYEVSPRFYVLTISFVFFTTALLRNDVIYVVAYGVGSYVAYLFVESIFIFCFE